MFLAGDIGGTRSRFYAIKEGKVVFEHIYSSKDFSNFSYIVEDFVKNSGFQFSLCVFGIAGVVIDGHCKTTNLPWEVSIDEIKKSANCNKGHLMNDLALLSYGITQLTNEQLDYLQKGDKRNGPKLVVCPGTGLGVACITGSKHPLEILSTEAGHIDFAPTTPLEMELLQYFSEIYNHVSIERFVSGSGIPNIYQFICKKQNQKPLLQSSEEITEAALQSSDPIATQTILLFLDLFASTLGNLALMYLPYQGVYVCGSLLKRLYPLVNHTKFIERFNHKGRFSDVLRKIPIYLVKEPKLAPLGAQAFINDLGE